MKTTRPAAQRIEGSDGTTIETSTPSPSGVPSASTSRRLHPSQRPVGPLDTSILADIALGLAETVEPSGPLEPWTLLRIPLLVTEAYDVWVMHWGPAAVAEAHDHDGSVGVIHVVSGQLLEATQDLSAPADGLHRAVVPIDRLHAGDVGHVGATDTHLLYNPSSTTTTTVNVYSPPLGPPRHAGGCGIDDDTEAPSSS